MSVRRADGDRGRETADVGAEDHFNTCIGFWELGIGNRTINTGKAVLSSKPCAKVGVKRMSGIVLKPS